MEVKRHCPLFESSLSIQLIEPNLSEGYLGSSTASNNVAASRQIYFNNSGGNGNSNSNGNSSIIGGDSTIYTNIVFRILQGTQPSNVLGQTEAIYYFEVSVSTLANSFLNLHRLSFLSSS
jgi:hypothetical protein